MSLALQLRNNHKKGLRTYVGFNFLKFRKNITFSRIGECVTNDQIDTTCSKT